MIIPKISKPKSVSDSIYNEAAKNCEFYKDQFGEVYLVTQENTTYKLKYLTSVNSVSTILRKLDFKKHKRTIKSSDIQSAYETIVANTDDCTDEVPVYVRIGQHKKTIYYDLHNSQKQVVKISKKGVDIIQPLDVKGMYFNTDKDMCEQLLQSGNTEYTLLDFINDFFIVEENQKLLLAVYICTAFIPQIKHPILIVEGEKGAGKSTLLEKIWQLVNPVKKELFAMPHNKDSLVTTLSNNYFCPIDNIGKITDEYSNILCQASTGGNLTKRKLYTDNIEFTINIKRVVALNGIDLGITQSDLLDRAILINLERIEETERKPMEIIEKQFNKCLPQIMSNIFEVLSKALAIYPNITLKKHPRMADFGRYGYAIAEAIHEGYGGKFIDEYYQNIELATEKAIENSPLLESIRYLVDKHSYWKGSATELLKKLHNCLRETRIGKNVHGLLPESPISLSRELTKHSHEFKKSGISIRTGRSKDRYIEISKIDTDTTISTITTTKTDLKNTENRKTLLDDED